MVVQRMAPKAAVELAQRVVSATDREGLIPQDTVDATVRSKRREGGRGGGGAVLCCGLFGSSCF
jgi:hypothetical protein